jgi:DNA-binding CsgD family transcriptional regulator
MRQSDVGFILLDSSFKLLAANGEALRVLAFPTDPARIQRVDTFLGDKLRTGLMVGRGSAATFVSEFRSGRRRYTCAALRLEGRPNSNGGAVLLLLERPAQHFVELTTLAAEYDLTPRERESVEFLVQGLTTKEIAVRMSVSPSTISTFLRLVMVKMGTNSRNGIVGKIVHPAS